MKRLLPCLAVVAVLLFMASGVARANRGGVAGMTLQGCGTCHGGQSQNTTVSVDGPRSVRAGTTVDFTAIVAHPNLQNAGFNLGIAGPAGAAGQLVAGDGSRLNQNQLTHNNGPKAFVGGQATFPFQWTAPAAHGIYQMSMAGNAVNDDRNGSDLDDWSVTGNIVLTVRGATLTAPAANATFCRGDNVNLAWTQTGYQNFRIEVSSNNGQTWTQVSASVPAGSNGFTWTVPNDAVGSATYVFRLTDVQTNEVAGQSAVFNVSSGPQFLRQPRDTSVCLNRPLELTVTIEGAGAQYRWQKNGQEIPGGNQPVFRINSVRESDAGVYSCVVFGCGTATSNAATVSISVPPRVTLDPLPRSVCVGDTLSLLAGGTGDGLRYQWFLDGAPINGATGARYSIQSAQLTTSGEYFCQISGTCSPAVATDTVRVTVSEAPAIFSQTPSTTVTAGERLRLNVRVLTPGVTYQWRKNGTDISGSTADSLIIPTTVLADSGVYTCVVSNTCGTTTSAAMRVQIRPSSGPAQLQLSSERQTVGQFAVCETPTVDLDEFIQNVGGSNLTITSISVEPAENVTIVEPRLPVVVEPGKSIKIRATFKAQQTGVWSGMVKVFAGTANAQCLLNTTVTPAIRFSVDTVVVPGGSQACVTLETPCDQATATSALFEGPGALSWSFVTTPSFPLVVTKDASARLCLTAPQEAGPADLVVRIASGNATIPVRVSPVSSVDDNGVFAKLNVGPIPSSDVVHVDLPDGARTLEIHATTGERVVSSAIIDGATSIAIPLRGLVNGHYTVIVRTTGTIHTTAIVIMN